MNPSYKVLWEKAVHPTERLRLSFGWTKTLPTSEGKADYLGCASPGVGEVVGAGVGDMEGAGDGALVGAGEAVRSKSIKGRVR